MPISFVFLVTFLVIQTCGKIWRSQVDFCVKSCVVLDLPHSHPLLSSLHPCMQQPCATMVWDCGRHGEHEERHTLYRGAHGTICVVHPAVVPERFHIRRGLSGILHGKHISRPATAQIPGQQPGPAGEAPCVLQRNQLPLRPAPDARLHINNQLCPDVPVLPGGAVTCVHIKRWCPMATSFGDKTWCATT